MTRNQIAFFEAKNTALHNSQLREIEKQKLFETRRSNVAKETEQHRSNLANESETARYHLGYLTEQQRSNAANERISELRAREEHRANVQLESLKQQTINETVRSNLADEDIRRYATAETARANRVNEDLKQQSVLNDMNIAQAQQIHYRNQDEQAQINASNAWNINQEELRQHREQLKAQTERWERQTATESNVAASQIAKNYADAGYTDKKPYLEIGNMGASLLGSVVKLIPFLL